MRTISRLGIEDAIAVVEDEIARVRPAAAAILETSDERIRSLAAGLDPFTIEAVEQDFERLAMRGPSSEGYAAATLVILRELMHHLQVKAIRFA